MQQSQVPSTATDDAGRSDEPTKRSPLPPAPGIPARSAAWTPGRVIALVIGCLVGLMGMGLLGAGGSALWADLSRRDDAGYVTTGVHSFSTAGSALATDPIELGDPGISWLYSGIVLGEVRIHVSPADRASSVFVAIGPTNDVDRYLSGVSRTVITDIWTDSVEVGNGGAPASPPGDQDFWVASVSGAGPQTLTWDPANGSWTVVVMNTDGTTGIGASTELAATMPMLLPIAIGSLILGGLFVAVAVLLVVIPIRRSRRSNAVNVAG
jgi:hypothetical protein